MTYSLRAKLILFACAAILFGAPTAVLAACDQTLSVGANIASAVSAAPNGSTICLNSGNYGTVNLSSIARSGLVTLRSTSATGARMSPQVNNVDFVRFDAMQLTNVRVSGCSTHIEFANSNFVAGAPGIYFIEGSSCGPQALLVDNVSFAGVNLGGNEGRLGTEGPLRRTHHQEQLLRKQRLRRRHPVGRRHQHHDWPRQRLRSRQPGVLQREWWRALRRDPALWGRPRTDHQGQSLQEHRNAHHGP